MKDWILKLGLALSLLFAGTLACAASEVESSNEFISIADIHFNPFASCKVSIRACKLVNELRAANYQRWDEILKKYDKGVSAKTGEDTNYHLFKLMLTELQRVKREEQPEFGLLLGDFLVHNFRQQYIAYAHDPSSSGFQQFVQKTMQYITLQLHQVFNDIDLYPVIGNNDTYTGDYNVAPQGKFLQDTAVTWSSFITDKKNRANLLATFPIGGYYSVTLADNKLRILLLDTVLFSVRSKEDAAAQQELKWLDQQLSAALAQNQSVFLAFHIPLGIDVVKTIQNRFGSIKQFWQSDYAQEFEDILKKYTNTVKLILPAHIHLDSFQLLAVNQIANIPVIFTPSISPIFGNNPGLKIFHYDPKNWELDNYETYFLPMTQAD